MKTKREPPEIHLGFAVQMEEDYSLVSLCNPRGEKYQRYFDTPFLNKSGITAVGQGIKIVFTKKTTGDSGEVKMLLTRNHSWDRMASPEELKSILASVDLSAIRKKFNTQP